MTGHQCAWAVANPDKPGGGAGTHCWGWSCRDNPASCHRKRNAANRAKAEGAAYRRFPGSTYQQAVTNPPPGHCRWCGGGIRSPKNPSALALNRTWHSGKLAGEPDCLGDYFAHTRMPNQLALLRSRDGQLCTQCGVRPGEQVDHRLALSLVVLLILPPHRWRYWGPGNLQLLCHPCHVAKTRQDVVDLKALRSRLAGGVAQGALAV